MTEMVYCYDGSFDGFLCCIFESYAKHEVLTAINSDEDSEPTLYPTRRVVTDREHARRVYRKIRQISPAAAIWCAGAFSPVCRRWSCIFTGWW